MSDILEIDRPRVTRPIGLSEELLLNLEEAEAEILAGTNIGVMSPPGEVVKLDGGLNMKDSDWVKFGSEDWKDRHGEVEGVLVKTLGLTKEQAKLAAIAILTEGYDVESLRQNPSAPRDEGIRLEKDGKRFTLGEHYKEFYDGTTAEFDRGKGYVEGEEFSAKYQFFEKALGVQPSFLRFIFSKEYIVSKHYKEKPAATIEEWGFMLMANGKDRFILDEDTGLPANSTWLLDGATPMFELRLMTEADVSELKEDLISGSPDKKDRAEKLLKRRGRLRVERTNFHKWFHHALANVNDLDGPDAPVQYMELVNLRKGEHGEITLAEYLRENMHGLKSEDTVTKNPELHMIIVLETWIFDYLYNSGVNYRLNRRKMKEMVAEMSKIFKRSNINKMLFGTVLLKIFALMSSGYEQPVPGRGLRSNNRGGMAGIEMLDVYLNLGDFEMLQEIMGTDSPLFTRRAWLNAYREVLRRRRKRNMDLPETGDLGEPVNLVAPKRFLQLMDKAFGKVSDPRVEAFLNDEGDIDIRIFDNGSVIDPEAFISLANVFADGSPTMETKWVLDKLLQEVTGAKYGIYGDAGDILENAQVMAWSLANILGAEALHETKVDGPSHSVLGKMVQFGEFLKGQINKRKMFVFPKMLYMIKQLVNAPADAFTASAADVFVRDEDGNVVYEHGKAIKQTIERRSLREAVHALQREATIAARANRPVVILERQLMKHKKTNPNDTAGIAALEGQLKALMDMPRVKNAQSRYREAVAAYFQFEQGNPGERWIDEMLEPGAEMWENITGGKNQINPESYKVVDQFGGVTFKGDEFRAQIMRNSKLVVDMLVKFNINDLSRPTREAYLDAVTGKMRYRKVPLVEAMFGYPVLCHPALLKRDAKGRLMSYKVKVGRFLSVRRYVIDLEKVNTKEGRRQIAANVLLIQIAAAMHSGQDEYTGTPRNEPALHLNVIEVLKLIKGPAFQKQLAELGLDTEEFMNEDNLRFLEARAFLGGKAWFIFKWCFMSAFFSKANKKGLFEDIGSELINAITAGI